jgi:hypothetical protein
MPTIKELAGQIDEALEELFRMFEGTTSEQQAQEFFTELENRSEYMVQKQLDRVWQATADAKWD